MAAQCTDCQLYTNIPIPKYIARTTEKTHKIDRVESKLDVHYTTSRHHQVNKGHSRDKLSRLDSTPESAALGRLCASKTRRVYFRAKEKHSFRPFTRDAMATILSQGAGNRMPHNDDDVKCHELHLPHFYSNRTRRRRCDIDGATNCLQFPLRYSCGIRGES